jgi:P-type conjugative transfer protein TrbJ
MKPEFLMRAARLMVMAWPLASQAAGGMGNVVFDPSNFARNTVSAAEAVSQTIEQVKANGLHLKQLQELIAARQPLSAAQLELSSGMSTAGEIARRVDEVRGLLNTLESLSADIRNMQGRFNVRFNAAQALGLGLAAYYEQVKQKAEAGAQDVQTQIDADRKALVRVNATNDQVLQWSQTIRGIDSQVAGLSLLGSQMNVVVAQNAELMSFMVRDSQARQRTRVDAQVAAQEEADRDVRINEAARAVYRKSQQDLQDSLRAPRR